MAMRDYDIEKEARNASVVVSDELVLLLSIAISAKRIADRLSDAGIADMVSAAAFAPTNQYGEGVMEAIQGSIRRGMQGIE